MKSIGPELIAELVKVGWWKEPSLLIFARADFRCEYCGLDLLTTFKDCFNARLQHRSAVGASQSADAAAYLKKEQSNRADHPPARAFCLG